MDIEKADLYVDVCFLTNEEGGRKNMPPIKDADYTYRPTLFLNNDYTIAYSCGMAIEKTREEIKPHVIMESVPVFLLKPDDVLPKLKIGDGIGFSEGLQVVAKGIITGINPKQ